MDEATVGKSVFNKGSRVNFMSRKKLSSDLQNFHFFAAAGVVLLCFFFIFFCCCYSRTVWPENDHIVSLLCKKQVVQIAAGSSSPKNGILKCQKGSAGGGCFPTLF